MRKLPRTSNAAGTILTDGAAAVALACSRTKAHPQCACAREFLSPCRVGHRRGGSHGPGSHHSSSFVVPASQQAPFGTDPIAAPHRMHGRDHQAQGELYAAMPRRESVQARVQEQELLYHSSVLGGEQRGTHAAAQSRVERQFGDDRQSAWRHVEGGCH